MIQVRRGAERGASRIDWLDSKHTFSFAEYVDPAHMGFRSLRVINEDKVKPGAGFGTHGHRDMEIVSYVLDGAIRHEDSTGVGAVIRPGDVQRMTAGRGVRHSEFNPSEKDPLHFLQIWILPEKGGLEPGYEQKTFPAAEKKGRLRLVASRDGREGSVTIHQDVDLYASVLDAGEKAELALRPGRGAWVQVAKGAMTVNGTTLQAGDGARIEGEATVTLQGAGGEALLFDLA